MGMEQNITPGEASQLRSDGTSPGTRIQFELCAETMQACLVARDGGADRIELCSALSEGGLTPSHALIHRARFGEKADHKAGRIPSRCTQSCRPVVAESGIPADRLGAHEAACGAGWTARGEPSTVRSIARETFRRRLR